MTTKTVTLKLRPPPDLIDPIRAQARAEGTTPRVIIERAVIQYIQAGCPSLMPRLERKADLDQRSTPREQRIAMAVRKATTERRGAPRKHPLPPDEQTEVDRRVAEWHRANPIPIYVKLYQPKKPKEKPNDDSQNDYSDAPEHEFTVDPDEIMKDS